MARWGRPLRLRVDNGLPWGTQHTLPSALALWLVGLAVIPIYGRPAHSTDNAVVERSHGVLSQWIEPTTCQDLPTLQQALTWASHTQRERYRSPHTYTRCQTYPDLFLNPRTYTCTQEAALWSLQRVIDYLTPFRFVRKVEKKGQLTLFSSCYAVGQAYARQTVEVRLDPASCEWCFSSDEGAELRRHPARELSYDLIANLKLAKRPRVD